MDKHRSGTIGWGLIAAGVLAWDALAPESLSHAFTRGMENERTRPFVLAALGYTAMHLLDMLPERYDLFDKIPQLKSNLIERVDGEQYGG